MACSSIDLHLDHAHRVRLRSTAACVRLRLSASVSTASRRLQPPQRTMPKQYFCNCVAHCTRDPTRPKEVSRSTWFAHRAYRESEAGQPPPPHATAATSTAGFAPSSRPRSQDSTPEPTERPSKVTRVETDNARPNPNNPGAPNTPQAADNSENGQPGEGFDGEGMDLDPGGGVAGNIGPNLANREDVRNKNCNIIKFSNSVSPMHRKRTIKMSDQTLVRYRLNNIGRHRLRVKTMRELVEPSMMCPPNLKRTLSRSQQPSKS
jgi:hypothetical protein